MPDVPTDAPLSAQDGETYTNALTTVGSDEAPRLRAALIEINEACYPNGGVPAWVIVEDVRQILEKLDIPSQSEGH